MRVLNFDLASSLYLGGNALSRAYLGSDLVWTAPAASPFSFAYLNGRHTTPSLFGNWTVPVISNAARQEGQQLLVLVVNGDGVFPNLALNGVALGTPNFTLNYAGGSDVFSGSVFFINAPASDNLNFVMSQSDGSPRDSTSAQLRVWEVYGGQLVDTAASHFTSDGPASRTLAVPAGGAVAAVASTGGAAGLTAITGVDSDAADVEFLSGRFRHRAGSRSGLSANALYQVTAGAPGTSNGNRRGFLMAACVGPA